MTVIDKRVVVIGAGPAGVRAAEALVAAGVRPVVIDEGNRAGGQIYRRQPEGFKRSYAKLYGSEAAKARSVHDSFDRLLSRIDYRPGTLAWGVSSGAIHTSTDGIARTVPYDALLVCSGATDRIVPVQGWDLAGCYSLGASQIALKAQACSIGRTVAFLGSGPLLYLVASQYIAAGAQVAAVLDTSPRWPDPRALAGLALSPSVLWKGLSLVRSVRRSGVPIRNGVRPVRILGNDERGVSSVVVAGPRGEEQFECDAVAIGWHLRSETQLADLLGCEFEYSPLRRQWFPKLDAGGRSSVAGVYLAGDGARIRGADGAEASGRLAALSLLDDLGIGAGHAGRGGEIAALQGRLRKADRIQDALAAMFPWPHGHFCELSDQTVVCRCEVVTAGQIRACVGQTGAREVNRTKAFVRCGMGRCQGRYCGHASAEIIAASSGSPLVEVGRIRTQSPIKPLTMRLAGQEAGE